jgi:putative membrane protein
MTSLLNSSVAVVAELTPPTLATNLLMVAIYAVVGVIIAVAGYKLFDICTPGNLHKEIIENRNVAAAIIGAAIIVGVCIIVAASILG